MISKLAAPSSPELAEPGDHQLLGAFVKGSERAFATLVRRHVDAVYSSALRQVGDAHTAADVTSAAFLILSRKAASLTAQTILPAWLHRTTRFVALKAIRAQARRKHYEEAAAHMQALPPAAETLADWEDIAPLLDASLTQLPSKDHQAVVLRFFQNKTFPEIAILVGGTEEAARKRVGRAVEKLRGLLTGRGVVMPAAVLAALLAQNSVQASPLALTGAISVASLTGASSPLVLETLRALRWRLWKQIAVTLAAVAMLSVVLFFVSRSHSTIQPRSPLQALRLLTQAANDGDGASWSLLVDVKTVEEQEVRSLCASNVVLQSELRRALLQRFPPADYQASGFPRLLDDTPEVQLASAVERVVGDQAIVHLPRGSNLKFVRVNGAWKFDFFRTTAATPAQLRVSLPKSAITLEQMARHVSQGRYQTIGEAWADQQLR